MSSSNAKRRRPWSLAARLTAWYVVSAFVLILGATAFLYWILVRTLDRQNDLVLGDHVHILRVLLRERPNDVEALKQEVELETAARQHSQVFLRVLQENGKTVAETPGMANFLPGQLFPTPMSVADESAQGRAVEVAGGRIFRVVAAKAEVGAVEPLTQVVQVALDRSHEETLLAGYRRSLWLVLGIALVGCTLFGNRIARLGWRPVQEIIAAAQRIRSTTLHERIAGAGLPAELAFLAATFNEMLDRLEDSFDRLSRFSSDIAHELRTPVNTFRGQIEVALGRSRNLEEYREVLASSLEEGSRLSQLIDSMLFLARAENPRTQIHRELLDVSQELNKVREFYEASASDAGIRLKVSAPNQLIASLDRRLLQQAVGNLVNNALAYTAAGGGITLEAKEDESGIGVAVIDTGAGIAEKHLPHIFERFYRVDRARSSDGGNAGLGLAIVKGIMDLHGGSVTITSAVGRGTRVTLCFPAARVP